MRNVALFDFDGTVIDGSEGIWKCINHATDKMGLPRATQAVLDSFIGPSLYDSFVKHYENDPDRANLFIAYYRERYSVTGKYECGLYPGIRDLLRDLNNDGFRLAVCSSKPLEFVKDIAAHLGVFDAFAYYSCPSFRDNVSNKTALATACLRFFGADRTDAVLIGDRIFDIEAAKGAGIAAMGVTYGFAPPGELEEAGADLLAENAEEIGVLLRAWRKEGVPVD